jgi:hypothetical protein
LEQWREILRCCTESDTHADTNSDSYKYPNVHSNCNAGGYNNGHSYSYSHAKHNNNCNPHCYPYRHGETFSYAETCGNAQAASHARTAPVISSMKKKRTAPLTNPDL